jgi:hypothetical protein
MRVTPLGKQVQRTVGEDQSVLAYAKYVARENAAGAAVTAAQLEVQANLIVLTVNGGAEVVYGTYTGNSGADNQIVFADGNIATVQNLIRALNGDTRIPGYPTGADALRRWRAGYGDFRPGFVIGAGDGVVAAAANALTGRNTSGVSILAMSTNLAVAELYSAGIGVDENIEGRGAEVWDHFETEYSSTTAGVKTGQRQPELSKERFGSTLLQCSITKVTADMVFATSKEIRIYDKDNNLIYSEGIAAGATGASTVISEENPVVGPMGSPLWVEIHGAGAHNPAGRLHVTGYKRIA